MNVLNGVCIHECPKGYFTQKAQCLQCHPTCETCKGPLKTDCIDCVDGSKKENYECKSTCPDGSYFESLTQECTVCNTNNCSLCVKTKNTCTKCFNPLVLDVTTYTCKQCCTRSIHGKLKASSCCNCPEEYTGFCLSQLDSNSYPIFFGITLRTETTNKLTVTFFVLIMLIAASIILYSALSLKKACKKKGTPYASVEYSVLNET